MIRPINKDRMKSVKIFAKGFMCALFVVFAISIYMKKDAMVKAYFNSDAVAQMTITKQFSEK